MTGDAKKIAADALAKAKDTPLWNQAVQYLRVMFGSEMIVTIRKFMKDKGSDWILEHHHTWGMAVRNNLREAKFGEAEFGIQNLDDIYVELVEEAVKE